MNDRQELKSDSLVRELWEGAQSAKQALDYGDQDWVAGLLVKAAREIERKTYENELLRGGVERAIAGTASPQVLAAVLHGIKANCGGAT